MINSFVAMVMINWIVSGIILFPTPFLQYLLDCMLTICKKKKKTSKMEDEGDLEMSYQVREEWWIESFTIPL